MSNKVSKTKEKRWVSRRHLKDSEEARLVCVPGMFNQSDAGLQLQKADNPSFIVKTFLSVK